MDLCWEFFEYSSSSMLWYAQGHIYNPQPSWSLGLHTLSQAIRVGPAICCPNFLHKKFPRYLFILLIMEACSVRVLMKNIARDEKTDLTRRNLPSYEIIVEHPDSLLICWQVRIKSMLALRANPKYVNGKFPPLHPRALRSGVEITSCT